MGYILNYSRWRAIHEAAIFEEEQKSIAPGAKLAGMGNPGDYAKLLEEFQAKQKADGSFKKLCADLYNKLVTNNTGTGFFINPGRNDGTIVPSALYSDKTGVKLFTFLFTAATGQVDRGVRKDILPEASTINQTGTLKLVPGSQDAMVKTLGNVKSYLETQYEGQEKESWYSTLLQYVNNYNVQAAFYGSANGQYVAIENAQITDGRFDLSKTEAVEPGEIVLLTATAKGSTVATRSVEEIKKEIAGIPADKQRADVDFDQGKATIKQEGIAKITTLAQTILERFKDKTIEKFELVSSASPEWTGGETMASYAGKTTSGTGDPGVGKDFASNNAKLAYDRGVSFMTELNRQLQAKGHPGFSNYTINWQISDKGGPGPNFGRYVDLNLVTNESQPRVEVVGTKVTGSQTQAEVTGGKGKAEFVVYKFKVQIPMTKKEAKQSLKAVPEEGAE